MIRVRGLAAAVVLLVAACSEQRPPVGGGPASVLSPGGGPTVVDSGVDASDGGADAEAGAPPGPEICVGVARSETDVLERRVPTDSPQPLGGTPTPGDYVLTEVLLFTGEGGASGQTGRSLRASLTVDSTTFRRVDVVDGAESVSGSTYVVEDTSLSMRSVCPTPGQTAVIPFSASGTSLVLFVGADTLETFTAL